MTAAELISKLSALPASTVIHLAEFDGGWYPAEELIAEQNGDALFAFLI